MSRTGASGAHSSRSAMVAFMRSMTEGAGAAMASLPFAIGSSSPDYTPARQPAALAEEHEAAGSAALALLRAGARRGRQRRYRSNSAVDR